MRSVLLLLSLCSLPVAAFAGGKQGAKCTSDKDCTSPLACRTTSSQKCELACDDKTKCPQDQRCVNDHGAKVCRPVNDGLDL